MKKLLLAIIAIGAISVSAISQTRMTLHEEFTGENCGPCASTNPTFWALCDGTTNPSKLIHISYMVPIPSAGWYCNRTTAIYTARDAYYTVPFAPYGRYDGHVPDATMSSPGHPGYFLQADIDSEAAVPSPFNMTVTNTWSTNFDSVKTTITVTCVTAFTGTLQLRTALIQTNDFTSSPGSNGETHFENVVQAMYPDANGTAMAGTWTVGMTQTYNLVGAVPSWVDKTISPYMVAWIQNDADKRIAQAAKASALPSISVDAASTATTGPTGLVCATGTYNLVHSMTLKNPGLNVLTSAKVYYQVDGGAYAMYSWTGSLASGATASVTLPTVPVTITASGYHTIIDSVGLPNGSTDINLANNVTSTYFFVENTTGRALPFSTSFEATDTAYYSSNSNNDGYTWKNWYNTTTPLGHSGTHAMGAELGFFPAANTNNVFALPELVISNPAKTKMTFWEAYSMINTSSSDALDVVYSTNCGSTWTSIWNMSGSAMSTLPTNSTTLQVPSSASNYALRTVSLSSVPSGTVMIGFKYTHGGGNSMWLDDVNFINTTEVNVTAAASEDIRIFPNPSKDEATLSFNLTNNSDVHIQIVDGLGRIVALVANEKMDAGAHNFSINTTALASGVYNVVIHTESGNNMERLTVIK